MLTFGSVNIVASRDAILSVSLNKSMRHRRDVRVAGLPWSVFAMFVMLCYSVVPSFGVESYMGLLESLPGRMQMKAKYERLTFCFDKVWLDTLEVPTEIAHARPFIVVG